MTTTSGGAGQWQVADPEPRVAPEPLTSGTSLAAIMDDPEAYRAVVDAFASIDPAVAKDFTRRTAWLPNQPLVGSFSLISPAVVARMESALAALNESRGV